MEENKNNQNKEDCPLCHVGEETVKILEGNRQKELEEKTPSRKEKAGFLPKLFNKFKK